MKKTKILFSIFTLIVVYFIISMFSKVEAKYVTTKSVDINYNTSDYYFYVDVDKTEITSLPATINVTVKNYEGDNYTDTNLKYNITVNEGYSIVIDNQKTERELEGNKKSEDNFVITIDKDENCNTPLINLQFNVEKPYKDILTKKIVYNEKYEFDYTGNIQQFIAPTAGVYQLECWGAQGGNASEEYQGGYGGYSKGVISLNEGETLYVVVGGAGITVQNSETLGGYNGGGSARTISLNDTAGSGGGATHISKRSGELATLENFSEDILMVASGGGGSYLYDIGRTNKTISYGGNGGGVEGGIALEVNCVWNGRTLAIGVPATVNQKGTSNAFSSATGEYAYQSASFGQGGDGTEYYWSAGGGAGYNGGGFGWAFSANGGCGYIGNPQLTDKVMYGYNITESTETDTKTISTTNVSDIATSNYAKSGNGYARITFIGE